MATSTFRKKNRQIIGEHADQLIEHTTGMDAGDENFDIARKFIQHKLDNHTFSDPSEHMIKKQMVKLKEKLVLHSQDERAHRLQYLLGEFHKRQTFKQVGISDTHMCILLFLQCMSVNPTGAIGAPLEDEDAPKEGANDKILELAQ